MKDFAASSTTPLSYAVIWHSDIDAPHFDLMFESAPGSDLATWRSPCWPIGEPTKLTRLKDHRRIYLAYEGVIPGNRGSVQRVDSGVCEISMDQPTILKLFFPTSGRRLILRQTSGDQWIVDFNH